MTQGGAPLLCAQALLHVRLKRRDPEGMARFLEDFGFHPLGYDGRSTQYFRTLGSAPWSVAVTADDQDEFVGLGFEAAKEEDLRRAADVAGSRVESSEEPGGGLVVRLLDPDGHQVDLMYGQAAGERLQHRPPAVGKVRVNQPLRTQPAPSPLLRLGHVVLMTPDFARSASWYHRMFGLIPSDIQHLSDGTQVLGFYRFNRYDTPTDHHSVALLAGPAPALLHISTETIDLDAIGQGHQYLRERNWMHHWGPGRHILGSQLFDYWKDPAGDEWEHYSDGDLLTADFPTGRHPFSLASLWAWGDDLPRSMRPSVAPPPTAPSQAHEMFRVMREPPRPWMEWGQKED